MVFRTSGIPSFGNFPFRTKVARFRNESSFLLRNRASEAKAAKVSFIGSQSAGSFLETQKSTYSTKNNNKRKALILYVRKNLSY